jgi:hypothetical protein
MWIGAGIAVEGIGIQRAIVSNLRTYFDLRREPMLLICGRRPADAHHLRFAQSRALVSDEFTVPLCRGHHREIDRCGDEASWWGLLVSIRQLQAARFGSKVH